LASGTAERTQQGSAAAPRAPRRQGALFPRLHPGPSPRPGHVAHHQRMRLCGALIEALAATPYDRLSVRELCALAGVSTRTFYVHFRGKHECFLAAHDLACTQALQGALAAGGRVVRGRSLERELAAFLTLLAENEHAARFCALESFSAGALGAQAARRSAAALAAAVAQLRQQAGLSCGPPWMAEALVAGVWRVVANRLGAGRAAELPALAVPLARWLATPCAAGPSSDLGAATPGARGRYGARALVGADPALGGRRLAAFQLSPRRALMAAALDLGCRRGAGALCERAVAQAAALPVRRLREHFESPAQCLAEALTLAWEELVQRLLVLERAGGAQARIAALIDALAQDAPFAQLGLEEVVAFGPAGVRARERMMCGIERLLEPDLPAQLERPLAIEAGAGAIWGALGACRRAGRLGASPSLVPALLALTSPEAIKQV